MIRHLVFFTLLSPLVLAQTSLPPKGDAAYILKSLENANKRALIRTVPVCGPSGQNDVDMPGCIKEICSRPPIASEYVYGFKAEEPVALPAAESAQLKKQIKDVLIGEMQNALAREKKKMEILDTKYKVPNKENFLANYQFLMVVQNTFDTPLMQQMETAGAGVEKWITSIIPKDVTKVPESIIEGAKNEMLAQQLDPSAYYKIAKPGVPMMDALKADLEDFKKLKAQYKTKPGWDEQFSIDKDFSILLTDAANQPKKLTEFLISYTSLKAKTLYYENTDIRKAIESYDLNRILKALYHRDNRAFVAERPLKKIQLLEAALKNSKDQDLIAEQCLQVLSAGRALSSKPDMTERLKKGAQNVRDQIKNLVKAQLSAESAAKIEKIVDETDVELPAGQTEYQADFLDNLNIEKSAIDRENAQMAKSTNHNNAANLLLGDTFIDNAQRIAAETGQGASEVSLLPGYLAAGSCMDLLPQTVFSDHAIVIANKVHVSPATLLTSSLDGVFGHELGHIVSGVYTEKNLSSHSAKKVESMRNCLVMQKQTMAKNLGNYLAIEDTTEEDFADLMAANAFPAGASNSACRLFDVHGQEILSNTNPADANWDFYVGPKGDPHSGIAFRMLHTEFANHGKLPQSCLAMMKDLDNPFKKNCISP